MSVSKTAEIPLLLNEKAVSGQFSMKNHCIFTDFSSAEVDGVALLESKEGSERVPEEGGLW